MSFEEANEKYKAYRLIQNKSNSIVPRCWGSQSKEPIDMYIIMYIYIYVFVKAAFLYDFLPKVAWSYHRNFMKGHAMLPQFVDTLMLAKRHLEENCLICG